MPSIDTLVADLNAGAIYGVGRKPANTDTTTTTTLSAAHKVKFFNVNAKFSLSTGATNRLNCEAAKSIDINGTYLHFQDNWTTVTKLDALRPIVASGNFSGCAYHVYRGQGSIYCCHISRPDGAQAEQYVGLLRQYAEQQGWSLVHDIGTRGRAPANGEVYIVSQLRGAPDHVSSIRLQLSSMGQIVGKTLVP